HALPACSFSIVSRHALPACSFQHHVTVCSPCVLLPASCHGMLSLRAPSS
ncbi:hypothetical protein NDU88_006443, partial [Pleurodeles waltl]